MSLVQRCHFGLWITLSWSQLRPKKFRKIFACLIFFQENDSVSCSVMSDSLWRHDCSPRSSSLQGILLRREYWIEQPFPLLQGIFLTQGLNPGILCFRQILYSLSHEESRQFSAQSCPTLRPYGLQHARLPCPSPNPGAYSNSCPSIRWCHPIISSSVMPSSSRLQSFPASESFLMSPFFISGGQSFGVSASASVLPMYIQDWFPLEWTGLISLWFTGLSRVFSNTTVQNHQFSGTQPSLQSYSHIHTWLLEKP